MINCTLRLLIYCLLTSISHKLFSSCFGNRVSLVEFLHESDNNYDIFTVKIDSSKELYRGGFLSRGNIIEKFQGNPHDTVYIYSGGITSQGGEYLLPGKSYLVFGLKKDKNSYHAFVCDKYSIILSENENYGLRKFHIDVLKEWATINKSKFSGKKTFYLGNQIIASGIYKDGKTEGQWVYYDYGYNKYYHCATRNYKNGVLHGNYILTDENGNILQHQIYEEGHMKLNNYYNQSKINTIDSFYTENKILFNKQTYYEDNKIKSIQTYMHTGITSNYPIFVSQCKHGLYESYWANGSLKEKGEFYFGKKINNWLMLSEDGDTISILNYDAFYDEDNKLQVYQNNNWIKGDTLKNKVHGKWEFFNNGVSYTILNFKNGNLDGSKLDFYENYYYLTDYNNGIKLKEMSFTYDGDTLKFCNYNEEGKLHGIKIEYYEKNKLRLKENYSNGFENGLCQSWTKDGNLIYSRNFVSGQLHGFYQDFTNGIIKEEGYYYKGARTGKWKRLKSKKGVNENYYEEEFYHVISDFKKDCLSCRKGV